MITLSGSCPENHRIAGIWGIIQETSALSKTINLPIHPASLNWVPATSPSEVLATGSTIRNTTDADLPGSLRSLSS